ncbi:MAG: transposase, partial [Candidatus Sifarchaeia archaeon]
TGRKATLFHSFAYKADSWSDYQRVVAKIEYGEKGENIRFIVTDMYQAKAQILFKEVYNARGRDELYIKEHKLYLKSDRTSCQRFEANQFRLFLHSAAYVLLHALKENLLQTSPLAKATFQTIRLKLFKVSAHIREMKTKIKVHFPRSYPYQKILHQSFTILTYLRGP